MNYKKFILTVSGCLLSVVMNASQTSASTSMLSSSSSSSTHTANASSRATTPMPTAITPRSSNGTQQATAQNTLGGISLNTQVLEKITDRVTQKLAQTLTAAGKGIAADLKNELNAAVTKALAEAKRTGNEVFVRGGEIMSSTGLRLTFIVVVVGVTVFLLLAHPYLAVPLITIFLSLPALYLYGKGQLRPLILDAIHAYGDTARLQHTLATTTQTLEDTNRTLAETRATLEVTRATLDAVSAKLNASHQ